MRDLIRKNKGVSLAGLLALIAGLAIILGLFWAPMTPKPVGPVPALAIDNTGTGLEKRHHWKQKWIFFSGTACETISTGDALTINQTTAEIGLADNDSGASAYCVGFAGNSAANGAPVQVVVKGILSGVSVPQGDNTGLTPYGAPLYLANEAGGITTYANIIDKATAGSTTYVGVVLPRSYYAVDSGVTNGSDTVLLDASFITGVSPQLEH